MQIYFADAQVQGASGGEDGIIVRCELDGTGVEIAADNFSDPRASFVVAFRLVDTQTFCGR